MVVTMRGSERPRGVSWSKPLLPPISPLNDRAATELFVALSDVAVVDEYSAELLRHIANVPLAVVLLANLASYESSRELLSRWRAIKTSMLHCSDGTTRSTSLDVSISLSLSSPGMM